MADPCSESSTSVLIVEDNQQAAKLLSLYLERAGYRTLIAENGIQALDLAARCHPMAITLDLLLPDRDGWQVLSELKASPLTRDIPVIIVSVLDRQQLGFRLGASEYLVKPVAREALLHALKRCIGSVENAPRSVMVVHTDLDALNLLALALADQNYRVIQALGLDEAASLARRVNPDLVVTNLLGGGMDCLALLARLKTLPETAHIPVLALTGGLVGQDQFPNGIEFVLTPDNDLVEERLLAAITMLFKRRNQPAGE